MTDVWRNHSSVVGHDFLHRESLARIADRRLQRLGHGDRAEALEQLVPAVDHPRHIDAERPATRPRRCSRRSATRATGSRCRKSSPTTGTIRPRGCRRIRRRRRRSCPTGSAPRHGEIFANPRLAKTLELIAKGGRDAFYKGPIARAIIADMRARNGLLDERDFTDAQRRLGRSDLDQLPRLRRATRCRRARRASSRSRC